MTVRSGGWRTGAAAAYVMLGIVMLLWAGNSIIGRAVRNDIPPFTLTFVRWTGAVLVLLPFAARHLIAERRAILAAWRPILLLAATGVIAFNALLYTALHHTTATNGLLIQAAIPAFVLLFDRIAFGTRPAAAAVAGVAISMVGVATIVFRGDLHAIGSFRFATGDLLVLAAVVAWAVYTIALRLRPAIHPLSLLATTFMIGAVAMLPLALTEWQRIIAIEARPGVIAAFAYVAVLPSVVAFFLYNAAVDALGPARPGQAITLMPLFGALLAAPLLGEDLHGYHLAGMALILSGILVTAILGQRPGSG
ncbi:drug/metabolite transporter (DMT)-like permease [Sphingomonas zeicaulis]|uniref:DMT family transporter n=1 Tax=Sphingomonas zeicaulis TaxID=1632740 RepID=UPI003D24F9D6